MSARIYSEKYSSTAFLDGREGKMKWRSIIIGRRRRREGEKERTVATYQLKHYQFMTFFRYIFTDEKLSKKIEELT